MITNEEAAEAVAGQQRVSLVVLPLYHVYSMVILMMIGFVMGAKLIILHKFEPRSFLQAIEKYKVNCSYL